MKHLLFSIVTSFLVTVTIFAQDIPRPEHPKPQFVRDQWQNLNGEWDFAFDFGKTGQDREWYKDASSFDKKITVPFAPESDLSGIGYIDHMNAVWYHRKFQVPAAWSDQQVVLHFGGVDYKCTAWVNGQQVGIHYGGSSSFSFDITKALQSGENEITVLAEDDIREQVQPAGKQSATYDNQGCCKYRRVTGIWQTVWLESRSKSHLSRVRILPDVDNSSFHITPEITNYQQGQEFKVTLYDQGKEIASGTSTTTGIPVTLKIKRPKLWGPDNPFLYDLKYQLLDNGTVIDEVTSYAGLRKTHLADGKIYLNDKPIFLRFVLDQGFYPDGIWTAPTDDDLRGDIEKSMAVGFNGARLHEKVFEERFHYWADKLGYLTWGEFPDWGMPRTYGNPEGWLNVLREWREVMMRDYNHPSIIAWTPLNETHSAKKGYEEYRRAAVEIYHLTRDLDPSRPVNTASGFLHIETDIWTVHNYGQDPEAFAKLFENIEAGSDKSIIYMNAWDWYGEVEEYNVTYEGQPYVVDEYGGTFWLPSHANEPPKGNGRSNWGYGKSADEVVKLISDLTKALTDNPKIAGYTYTQLTDVWQEINGVYTFDRELKFPIEDIREALTHPAAIEQE